MDLSNKAKSRRDAVEAPLFRTEKLLDDLEDCRVRIEAAMAVWPETQRTLRPALRKQQAAAKDLLELKTQLSDLWKQGSKTKWRE